MNVSNFASQVQDDYARPNLFTVAIPEIAETAFMVKATTIPAAVVGVVEVPYKNRKIKVPGDRTFQDWTITVINDIDYTVRSALLEWQAGLQQFGSNDGFDDPIDAHKTMTVHQLNRMNVSEGQVQITGWPSEVGTIDLSWETTDAVQEYTVTFSVTHSTQF